MAKVTEVYCPHCEREERHLFYEEVVQCDNCSMERYYDEELLWQYGFAEEC